MKSIICVGSRPNLVKLPSFLKLNPKFRNAEIVWLGQHWDKELTTWMFGDLDIPLPNHYYEIGKTSSSQVDFLSKALAKSKEVIDELKPENIFVVGDCNVTLAAAIAAKKEGITLSHIEAGCRATDVVQEEANRRMVDQISDVLYAPDGYCAHNLHYEQVPGKIILSYNYQLETLRMFGFKPLPAKKHILLTLHRRENLQNTQYLKDLIEKVCENAAKNKKKVIFPVHPHTRNVLFTQGQLFNWSLGIKNLELSDPLPYKEFLDLIASSSGVVTDSGGVQLEADYLAKPCITVREDTEWRYTLGNKNVLTTDLKLIGNVISAKFK